MLAILGAVLLALLPVERASAQGYPAKPVRMILPFPPGGPNDIFARVIAQKLSASFSQQVDVDNRGGASGIIGAELAARAAPDGYTLLFGGAGTLSINPSLYTKLPYDALKDFAPVSLVATTPFLLVTHPSLPVKTVHGLVNQNFNQIFNQFMLYRKGICAFCLARVTLICWFHESQRSTAAASKRRLAPGCNSREPQTV